MNFIDLHGVLVDFVAECNNAFDIDIYADPKMLGDWHAPRKVIPEFGTQVDALPAAFWESMPLLPDAHAILAGYDNPIILTTPWGNAASYIGTVDLIRKHFPNTPYIFSKTKWHLAAGNTLLDDKEENIARWRRHGGVGILHPGLMNRKYHEVN